MKPYSDTKKPSWHAPDVSHEMGLGDDLSIDSKATSLAGVAKDLAQGVNQAIQEKSNTLNPELNRFLRAQGFQIDPPAPRGLWPGSTYDEETDFFA